MSASASVVIQKNLVGSDPADAALLLDPAFTDAWGIALRPAVAGGHWWVASADTSRVTLYVGDSPTVAFGQDGLSVLGVPGAPGATTTIEIAPPTRDGVPLPAPSPTPATIMPPSTPTGQVYSGSIFDFPVSGTSLAGAALANVPARFVTVSEDGTIAAWGETGLAPAQRMNAFTVVIDNSAGGAIYTGVAISAENGIGNMLYAANFSQGRIDVFDARWQPVPTSGFVPHAPGDRDADDFAPYNIERVFDASLGRGVLIVAYAKVADAAAGEEEPTDGFVAKYEIDGTFVAASDGGGLFQAPWGVALAPRDFGAFGGALLVGNSGDARIVALDIERLEPIGYLRDADGGPIAIDGLRDIAFGNGVSLGHADRLYFSAGPRDGTEGLFGSLRAGDDADAPGAFLGTAEGEAWSGGSAADTLDGAGGDDTMLGAGGGDHIVGAAGRDRLFGGDGEDRLEGGADGDELNGGRDADTLHGGRDADFVRGGQGTDLVHGDGGDDWHLNGNAGNDSVLGGDGDDAAFGGRGDDVLFGGAGADRLDGNLGDDTLDGGAGADLFVFAAGSGRDLIVDLTPGDRIGVDLTDGAINGIAIDATAALVARVTGDGIGADNARLDLGAGNFLEFANVPVSAITADMFLLL